MITNTQELDYVPYKPTMGVLLIILVPIVPHLCSSTVNSKSR